MIGFEVTIGSNTHQISNSNLGNLSIAIIHENNKEGEDRFFLESGGLDSSIQQFFNYKRIKLEQGDVINIHIKEIEKRDQPERIEEVGKTIKELTDENDRRMYWQLKEKLEKKGLI